MCKVISIVNQKGGCSKTTSAVNIGIGLANAGKKVVLIDADAQGSLTASTTMNLPLMLYSVYKNENNYGYSNAIGVCIVIAGVVCMTLINKAMRVNEEDY